MTYPGRTPSWDEIEEFCKIDGWQFERSTDHSFFRKVLPSGEVLETHTSFAGGKTMSQRVFSVILRNQLEVSRLEFWKALQTGQPVDRPDPEVEDVDVQHDGWVVLGLIRAGVPEVEIAGMTEDEAKARLYALWAEQQSQNG